MANINEQDKNFKKVRFYQDKILLETELNELQDIQNRRFEEEVYESLGNVVIYGFEVSKGIGWNLTVNTGRSYIHGKVVTSKGGTDTLSVVQPADYVGDLTLYVILKPRDIIYLPEEEGDKGWEYGVGEPTTYRTEESYEVVIAQAGSAIIIGGQVYAQELPSDPNSYIELARILRPESAVSIDDCTVRDTRTNLIMKLGEIVNKKFYMKAEQQYNNFTEMKSPNELLITPGGNTKDDRDRICVDLNTCHAELTTLSAEDSASWVYDVNGNKIDILSIVTQDVNNETLDEATVTLSGDVSEKVYVPIIGASNMLLNENPDFENGTSDPLGWIPSYRSGTAQGPIFDVSGYKSKTGDFAVGVAHEKSYTSENLISVTGGNEYIITASLMANNGSALNYQFAIEWYDSGEVLIGTEVKEVIITTEHKKYIALITAPGTAAYAKIKLNGDGANNNNWFWVDNVEFFNDVSTANLLTNNASFETGGTHPEGWVAGGSPTYSKDGSNSNSGNDAVRVSYGNSYSSEDFIDVAALNEYIMTAYIKADSGSFNYQFKIEWYDENEIPVSSDAREIIVTASYEKYIAVFSVPATATKAKLILNGDGTNAANWFYVDDVELIPNIGTGNLLQVVDGNVSFEESSVGPHNWVRSGSPEYSSDGTESNTGTAAIKVSNNNSYTNENFVSITGGNEYIIVAYLRALSSDALDYTFKISWYDASQVLINTKIKTIEISTEYEKYLCYVDAPGTAAYMKLEWNGDNSDGANWFWVDSVEFIDTPSTFNLLTNNNNFEIVNGAHPDGWTAVGAPVYSNNGSNSYQGLAAVKVSYGNVYQSNQQIAVTIGDEYVVGAYIKADGVETKCRFKVDWYDSGVALIGTSYEYFYVTSSYDRYFIRVVAPASAATMNIVLDGDGINGANWFWYDAISVLDYDEGATNLIASENSDFEDSDPDEWTRTGSPVYNRDGSNSYEGEDAVKVSFGNSYKSDKFVIVEPDVEYVLGARIKADGAATQCRIVTEWYDNGQSLLGTSSEDIVVTATHKHYYVKVVSHSSAAYVKLVIDGDGSSGANWFWYDSVEIYAYDNNAANMILEKNPSFEMDDIVDWSAYGSPTYDRTGAESYDGNAAVMVSKNNYCRSNQFISVLESNEYIIGARIKADGAATQCRILVEWYDEYYDLIGTSTEDIVVTSSYEHYCLRVVSPASIVKYMKVVLDGDGDSETNWFWYDSIEVYDYDEGATNLIASNNPGFETGVYVVDEWDVSGSPIYSTSGFDSYSGKDALKVAHDNTYTGKDFIGVTEGLPYILGAYIRSDNPSALTYQFRVDWYDNSQAFISSSTVDISVSNDNFVYRTAIVTAPTGGIYLKLVLDGDGNNSSNWFWIDRVSILPVTEHTQFPIVLHYGYEYTLANLPANFAMADIISGVSIDMAIQEILGNRYFDGSLPIGSDGTNSVDRRLVSLWDELHTHRHKGLISPRLEARDIDLINPPGTTSQATTEDHVTTVGTGQPDDQNPHGLSSKNIDIKEDEVPYPNEYSDDRLEAKTSIHGQVDVSIADHILEVGTGIPDADNPHGLDSSDIEHNAETNPDNSFKTIEQALFDRVKDLHGDGVVRGLRIFPEDSNYVKITDGYAYINGKRIRVGNSIIIKEILKETETSKVFRITGALVNDPVYITYFGEHGYYRWIAPVYQENGMLQVEINNGNLSFNYTGIGIVSYNNLKWDKNERFEMQLTTSYKQINVPSLSGVHDRVDIIVVSNNGVISLVKGVEDGKRRKSVVPNNSMKIAEVYVNYNGSGTDNITYDDVGDYRYRIDWKHGSGGGSGIGGSSDTINNGSGTTDVSVWKRLQALDTTIDYYKQLFVSAAEIGFSLSRMAVETFVDNSNIDEENSENVRLDDSNIYLGTDEEPLQSMDLVADWRNLGPSGGIGTWVSKTYIGEHSIGINNLLEPNNPDFEIGAVDPSNWDKIGLPVYSTDGSKSYKGLSAVKVSAGNSYTTTNFITINATKSYKIVAFIKAEQININCRFKANWYDVVYANVGESSVVVHTDNSRYDKYEAVLVAPAGASYVKITIDGDGVNSDNWFWFDSLELVELDNVDKVLFFVRETLNGGNNSVRYYLSNDGSIPTEQVQPNALHVFSTIGSELRVKIEIEPSNNDGNQQPRVHSFSLVWGIGQGHNHNGENSTNVLGEDPQNDNLTIIGGLTLIGSDYNINDVASLIAYLQPPQPPFIGGYYAGTDDIPFDPVINGPNDMRLDLNEFNFVTNAYIPNDAILLPGTDIVPGNSHDGVTSLSSPVNVYCYIYPADKGYLEVTVNGVILGYLDLTAIWADNTYTNRSQAKLNQLPRTLTEQLDYLIGGPHGSAIELTERMTYVPPQTDRPFPYYQIAKCRFVFNPYSWQNNLGIFGEEELGKIKITHYTDNTKLTIIGEDESQSIYNDVN